MRTKLLYVLLNIYRRQLMVCTLIYVKWAKKNIQQFHEMRVPYVTFRVHESVLGNNWQLNQDIRGQTIPLLRMLRQNY